MVDQTKPHFNFLVPEDKTLSLEDVVMQSLGAASMCWEQIEEAGIFQAERARAIGKALIEWVRNNKIEGPRLGLATTRQLVQELQARIETDYASGGGGLDYTTVHGRPPTRPTQ